MVELSFNNHRQAALALLNSDPTLNRKETGFLGNLVGQKAPLSDRQADWLAKLLEQAELPPFVPDHMQ